MTSRLALYNSALLEIGERSLATITEDRPPRYALDDCYDRVVRYCLEQGLWNFATRAKEIHFDPGIEPTFGYRHAFQKPDDIIRLSAISPEETLSQSLERFTDEVGYWWCDLDVVYVSYVSSDSSYGLDLTRWPETFSRYVELELAGRIVNRETASEAKLDRLMKQAKRALIDARSKDAMGGPNRIGSKSNWMRARLSGSRINGTGRGL